MSSATVLYSICSLLPISSTSTICTTYQSKYFPVEGGRPHMNADLLFNASHSANDSARSTKDLLLQPITTLQIAAEVRPIVVWVGASRKSAEQRATSRYQVLRERRSHRLTVCCLLISEQPGRRASAEATATGTFFSDLEAAQAAAAVLYFTTGGPEARISELVKRPPRT